jgi:hypothetical protein
LTSDSAIVIRKTELIINYIELLLLSRLYLQNELKIRFNPKYAQIEFETSIEQTTFEKYYPIPADSQMEIKPNISLQKKPDLKLSYFKLEKRQ